MIDNDTQGKIDTALSTLRTVIQQAVRDEQLIDRLTKLGNDEALSNWIQAKIVEASPFWVAFIEVDRFKSVNDAFGYDAADELLRRIAEQIRNGARNFFMRPGLPFRAHGDEFFIGGLGDGTGVDCALEQIRSSVGALRVSSPSENDPSRFMSCTVSAGWATSVDCMSTGDLNERRLRGFLEAAVAEAKIARDRVVRYDPSHAKNQMRNGRTDCMQCQSKLDLRVPAMDLQEGSLICPNCGASLERPVGLRPSHIPQALSSVQGT